MLISGGEKKKKMKVKFEAIANKKWLRRNTVDAVDAMIEFDLLYPSIRVAKPGKKLQKKNQHFFLGAFFLYFLVGKVQTKF